MGVNMEEKITLLQAYKAMYEFLRDLYYREGQPSNLGNFLSDLQFLEDGKPLDPAAWYDWLEVVKRVLEDEQK
jgi:hypothetical protein